MLTKHNGFAVLRAIGARPKRITVTELEVKTHLSRNSVRRWLDRLEAEKLITCERPSRGLPYHIQLTDKGRSELANL